MNGQGKIAIITGAGTGVGKSAAVALAAEGWTVVLSGRRPEPLDETVREIQAAGGKAEAAPTDTTDQASVQTLFNGVKNRHGRLDLLFNNAGTNAP